MPGQILVEFGNDAAFYVCIEQAAQLRQRARWRCDEEASDVTVAGQAFERVGDGPCEPLLADLMPVGLLDGAATVSDALEAASRVVGSLFARRRIVVPENPFGFQS